MKRTRILIVDDHPVVRKGLHMLLNTEATLEIVGEAADGRQAVSKVAELRPDVVLTDLVMPNCDGVAAIREIKALMPEVKIIVLSSFGDQARVRKAIEAGADGYMLKDADGQDLIDAIEAVQRGGMPLNPQVASRLIRVTDAGQSSKESVRLTERERQILRLIAAGLSNRAIAGALGLRTGTVKIHASAIFAKLNASNRTEAAAWAIRMAVALQDTENQSRNG